MVGMEIPLAESERGSVGTGRICALELGSAWLYNWFLDFFIPLCIDIMRAAGSSVWDTVS